MRSGLAPLVGSVRQTPRSTATGTNNAQILVNPDETTQVIGPVTQTVGDIYRFGILGGRNITSDGAAIASDYSVQVFLGVL